MNTIASSLLLILGIVAFQNYRQGTLSQWFAAKFLNAGGPPITGARTTKAGAGTFPSTAAQLPSSPPATPIVATPTYGGTG